MKMIKNAHKSRLFASFQSCHISGNFYLDYSPKVVNISIITNILTVARFIKQLSSIVDGDFTLSHFCYDIKGKLCFRIHNNHPLRSSNA